MSLTSELKRIMRCPIQAPIQVFDPRMMLRTETRITIRNITVNKPKRLVTVVFTDGEHEIIQCAKGDHFDVNIGVALAIAQHLYGSKNKFHKDVIKKSKVIENAKGKKK